MSSARPDLPNDVAAARSYVKWVGALDVVDRVMVSGSRAKGTSRPDSDWDLIAVSDVSPLRIVQPRDTKQLHADLAVSKPDGLHRFPNAVEVWPNDEKGLLK